MLRFLLFIFVISYAPGLFADNSAWPQNVRRLAELCARRAAGSQFVSVNPQTAEAEPVRLGVRELVSVVRTGLLPVGSRNIEPNRDNLIRSTNTRRIEQAEREAQLAPYSEAFAEIRNQILDLGRRLDDPRASEALVQEANQLLADLRNNSLPAGQAEPSVAAMPAGLIIERIYAYGSERDFEQVADLIDQFNEQVKDVAIRLREDDQLSDSTMDEVAIRYTQISNYIRNFRSARNLRVLP